MPSHANATALIRIWSQFRMDPSYAAPVLDAAPVPAAANCTTLWEQLQHAVQLR
jgi:hypothetical protein